MEAKTMSMNNANKLLQNEVSALRSEVAQLKLQLLAHKDCPVTLALLQTTENNSTHSFHYRYIYYYLDKSSNFEYF